MQERFGVDFPIVKVAIDEFKPIMEGGEQYPLEFIENYSVIKLKETDQIVYVGLTDIKNHALIENLIMKMKVPVTWCRSAISWPGCYLSSSSHWWPS